MNALIRSWLAAFVLLMLAAGSAYAFDINNASVDDLQQIKGVGPVIAKRIASEPAIPDAIFAHSLADLQERVPGVGPQLAANLNEGGALPKGKARQSSAGKSSPTAKGKIIEVASIDKPGNTTTGKTKASKLKSSKTGSSRKKAQSGSGRKSATKTVHAAGKKSAHTVTDKKTK